MSNVEINDLTAKTTPDETDELEIQETAGGTSKKITRANFIPDSSATVKGKVELATDAEALTGTDTTRATTPANVKAVADTKANTSHTHAAADVTSGLFAAARIATGTPDGSKFLRDDQSWQAIPGGGDMLASTYDPQAVAGDAFDTDNHTDGTTNKVYSATEKTKLAGIETAADVTDATNVAAAGATMDADTSLAGNGYFLDEDNMASNSATKVPSQQSVKAYVDAEVAGVGGGTVDTVVAGTNIDVDATDPANPIVSVEALTPADIGLAATVTELDYVDGVTSAIQTQLDAKQASGATLTSLEGLSLVAGDILYATGADTLARLPKGTASQELRINAGATAPEWFTPSAGGGQTLVTHIVAASGGTHTSLTAALAAAANGDTIWVREGTYTEAGAITSSLTELTIIGEGKESSIVSMTTNNITLSGANVTLINIQVNSTTGAQIYSGANFNTENCTLKTTSTTASAIRFTGVNAQVQNNRIYLNNTSTGSALLKVSSTASVVSNNYIYFNKASGSATIGVADFNSASGVVSGNQLQMKSTESATNPCVSIGSAGIGTSFVGNTLHNTSSFENAFLYVTPQSCTITGNTAVNCRGKAIEVDGGFCNISDNNIKMNTDASGDCLLYCTGSAPNIGGNYLIGAGTSNTVGIHIGSGIDDSCVTGNTIRNVLTGVNIAASSCDRTLVSNNAFSAVTTPVTDLGTASTITCNTGVDANITKEVRKMKNTSGATINAGNVVILKAAANGDEITTTTSAGDSKVFGVATAAISDTAYGNVQVIGKTTILTVNGTTDIAIGDYLSCYTSAGIAQKASAGHMVFAMALEAYTADDSSGVIDALILNPRLI